MGINGLDKLVFNQPSQCNKCGGKLEYKGIGHYECVNCRNEMLDDYGILKEYFETHGPTPILKLAEETGLSREKIRILLKDGTVEFSPGSRASLNCEICGAKIRYGRYCPKCSRSSFGEGVGERFFPGASTKNLHAGKIPHWASNNRKW